MAKKVKTNVRLFKVEDAIWMCLPEVLRDRTLCLVYDEEKMYKKGN